MLEFSHASQQCIYPTKATWNFQSRAADILLGGHPEELFPLFYAWLQSWEINFKTTSEHPFHTFYSKSQTAVSLKFGLKSCFTRSLNCPGLFCLDNTSASHWHVWRWLLASLTWSAINICSLSSCHDLFPAVSHTSVWLHDRASQVSVVGLH